MTSPLANPPTTNASDGVTRHFSGVSLSGTLTVSLVAIALVFIVVAVGAVSVISSAFTGSIHEGQPRDVLAKLVAEHDKKTDEWENRFKDRYIFFKPPPKPPAHVDKPDIPPPPPPPPEKTGPPATYQGPSIAWVIGDDVYFNMLVPTQTEKYMRVRVGEEHSGVKVVSVEKLPRTVRVAHMGGEYDVKVFGEGMSSTTLFPTLASPRPSILVPGFIPAGQAPGSPAAAPLSEPVDAADAGAAAEPITAMPADKPTTTGERPSGRVRGQRGARGGGRGGGGGGGGGGEAKDASEAARDHAPPSANGPANEDSAATRHTAR